MLNRLTRLFFFTFENISDIKVSEAHCVVLHFQKSSKIAHIEKLTQWNFTKPKNPIRF